MRIILLLTSLNLFAATITVTNNNDSGAGSLRQAIIDANTSDTIDFGISSQTITFGSSISIDKSITIDGGNNDITLSGDTLFDASGSLSLQGFTGAQLSGNFTESGDGGSYTFFEPAGPLTISGNLTAEILTIGYTNNDGNSITFSGTTLGIDRLDVSEGGSGQENGPNITFDNDLTVTAFNFETGTITAPSFSGQVYSPFVYNSGNGQGGQIFVTDTFTQNQVESDTSNNARLHIGVAGSFVKTGAFKMTTYAPQPNLLGDVFVQAGTLEFTTVGANSASLSNAASLQIADDGTATVAVTSFDFPSTVSGDGTLNIGANQSISTNLSTFAGNINVTNGTTTFTASDSIENTNELAISSGAITSIAAENFTFPTILSGAGTIAFSGDQTLTTALTDFPGNVSVTSGTLSLNSATALENANALSIASGTTATFSQESPSLPSTTGTGNLTFGASVPIGSNTAAFAGNMNITAGTLNIAGTTAIQNTAALAVSDDATASFTAANTTMPTAITGAGTLAFSTNQTLTSAPSAFTGDLSVTAGTLSVGATTAIQNAASLAISDGAVASFTAANTTMPTAITGAGTLRFASTQTLATQASNFTGAVALTSGTTTFSNTASLENAASLAISDGATANINATSFTYPSTITGGGTIGFSQNLTLGTQLSSFTGKVQNTAGTLTISDATSIENAASLTIETGATTSLPIANTTLPTLLGSGTLSIASDQTLTTDAPNFSGTIAIASDTTFLNATMSGASATVATGATLRGAGTINNLTVNGILFPGNSIGTMTVLGNYTQAAGSELQVEIAPDGTADLIDATGTATIGSDTTLTILPEAGTYSSTLVFTIVDADGGIAGEFTNVELDNTSGANIGTLTAVYLANQVQLTLGQSITAFCNAQSYLISNSLTLGNRFQYGILNDQNIQRIVTEQTTCNPSTNPYRSYLIGDYSNGHTEVDSNMIASKYLLGGMQMGVEKMINDDTVVGGLFGYGRYKSESYNRCSYVNSNNYTIGLYGEKYFEKWIVDGAAMYTLFDFHSDRETSHVKQNDANFFGNGVSAHLKGSYLGKAKMLHLIPSLGLDYYYNYGGPYRENNIAPTRYNVSSQHFNNLFADLGLRLLIPIEVNKRVTLIPQIAGSWLQPLTDSNHTVKYKNTNSINPWTNFDISSLNEHTFTLTGELTASINSCISINALGETSFASTYAPTAQYRLGLRYTY